ncbi:MAG: glutamyl-tRNA reductase [Verrucomicrobiae bacterium]|nr:glutamyl-tRNA reductase [Verrucomicrobiae bacterium]
MKPAGKMELVAMGLSHHTAPVEVRELFAVSEADLGAALVELAGDGAHGAVLVSTCNRVEIWAEGEEGEGLRAAIEAFFRRRGLAEAHREALRFWRLPDSVQRLYELASGLDSMVVGETEILGQVKEAYRIAHEAGRTGPLLNRLFQGAFAAAKAVRSATRIGRGSVSVGSVAADLAGQLFGDLTTRGVLLLGAGEIAETAARALLARGATRIRVANRSAERAQTLAAQLGGEAVPWEDWASACESVAVLLACASAPEPIVTSARLASVLARRKEPLFVMDLAVPRNVERSAGDLDGVYLYDMDDLQVIAERNLAARQEEIATCRQILRAKVAEFFRWMEARERIAGGRA